MSICLCIVYGYFYAPVAEMSSCDRDCLANYLLYHSLQKMFADP